MFKLSRQQKDHRYFCGNKYEKYSIKKLKVGAASVLVGTGFLFGYNLDQVKADEQKTETATVMPKSGDTPQSANKVEDATEPKQEKAPEVGTETPKSGTKEETVPATSPQVAETNETSSTKEIPAIKETPATKEVPENKVNKVDKEIVNSSTLREKLADLEAQIERIRGNKKQASQIQNAEKLVADAKQYLEALDTTQKEVDAKAKEISSLTKILKSIKAEETPKINKNQDRRSGKMLRNGTGFRIGTETAGGATTSTTPGVGADVKDATEKPAVKRPPYTDRKVAESIARQVTWLDFGDEKHWHEIDKENGKIYLKEGSYYENDVYPGYRIKIKVKSLKPFQATEIYRKRMEAGGATEEEKVTFDPNATNKYLTGSSRSGADARVTASAQDQWSEIRENGINTGEKKTRIAVDGDGGNWGVQFDVTATYNGKTVRPAVLMADAESANPGENILFTTNGDGWKQVIELKKNREDAKQYTPTNLENIHQDLPDGTYPGAGSGNWNGLKGLMGGTKLLPVGKDGKKIVPKYFGNPDQLTGGLGTGVFGPGVTSGPYSVPVVMTKNATEVGMYILSQGMQSAMMGVIPLDEGDAPESYGEAYHTMNTKDGMNGTEVKQPYLGSQRPDPDAHNRKDWNGDDDGTDTSDEGINQLLPDSLKGREGNIIKANISNAGYYTLNIQAHTGGAEKAYIRSWIDFNNNGHFDSDEASDIAEITQDGDVKLHFKNKTQKDAGQLLQAGTRVRIATSRDEIENPTGLAFSGEVEDFNAKITHPPKGDRQTSTGDAAIGNNKAKQGATVHFTPKGKNIYKEGDVDAEIDTTVPPVYIDNKTGKIITLSDENTYTVKGQGTYKFTPNATNPKDIDVEFTPAKGFVGEAHGITIRRQDTNRTTTEWGTNDDAVEENVNNVLKTMDGLYIPKVIMPAVTPRPNDAKSSNIQGFAQKGTPTFTVETSDAPVTASVKHQAKLIDPRTNIVTNSSIVDALDQNNNKIGTYEIVPETGEVIFTPNVDYKGEVKPARVSVPVVIAHDKDDNDITVNTEATYSPTIKPVIPTAEAGKTEDVQGKPQVSRIVLNIIEENADKAKTVNFNRSSQVSNAGEHVELNNESLTLVDASGVETNKITTDQGEYVLDKVSKTITFTPKKTFHGQATPVRVQIKDANGTKVETTYTPTVLEVNPTGKDSATSGPQGLTQKSPIVFNQREEEDGKTLNFDTGHERVALKPETLTLLNGSDKVKSITVPNVGTYELVGNAITFTPAPAYHGTAEGVNVQVEDENGKIVTKKYVPTVTELTVTPGNKTTKNIQGETQEDTPTFTIPAGSTNATVTSRTLVDPADQKEKDSVKVEGKGTFTIDGNGKVTFVPLPTYKGDVDPITVKATVTITNGKNESTTITSTASYKPIIVPAEIDKAPATSTNLQGLEQTGRPTFTSKAIEVDGVQKTISVQANSYKLVKDGKESESLSAYKAGTTEQIGTYTINSATGQVTFTPSDKTYSGEVAPVSVQATGSNGVKVQTTYTPIITPVTPTAEKSATSGLQGKPQTSSIVLDTKETGDDKGTTVNFNKGTEIGANGERVNLDPTTLTLLDSSNAPVDSVTTPQGKYELDKVNKTITFTPNKDFVGTATPVKVQIKDVNGTKVETTYTPTVTDVTMKSVDKTSEKPQGQTQTGKPEFKVSDTNVGIAEYKLVNPTNNTLVEEYKVENQGTYSIDKETGEVTFVPKPGFTGRTNGITVRATDENGETKDATYTPSVTPLKVTPENKSTMNIQGLPQEATPTFKLPKGVTNASVTSRKLVDPADKVEKDTVVLSGKGTFTINRNGKVVFTPEPNYADEVPEITVKATITVTNDDNDIAKITSEATYRPIIIPAELETAPAKTANVQGAEQTGRPTFTPHTEVVNGVEKTVSVQPNSYKLVKDGVEVEGRTTPAYKKNTQEVIGKYTINIETGEVTFTPTDKAFKGEVEPATVQATGSNGVKVKTSYTPTIIPVTPSATDTTTTKVQGATQEGTVTFTPGKATIASEQKSVPMDITAYKLLGGENGTTPSDTVPAMSEDGTKQVGTYTIKVVDGQPVVTFTPTDKAYAGKVKPVTVQGKDTNGSEATATYTPVITPITPTSENGTSSGPQGVEQTGRVIFNPGKEPGTENTPVAIDNTKMTLLGTDGTTPVESLTVSKDGKVIGTYTLVKDPSGLPTGEVKFTPTDKLYVGEVPPATVQVKDANGTPAKATYTPTLTEVTPKAKASETTGVQGQTQTSRVVLNQKDETDNTTVNFDKGDDKVALVESSLKLVNGAGEKVTRVTVENEGTYELSNGAITFTPLPTFHGTASGVSVQVEDINGKVAKTTYTPTVTEVTPQGTNAGSEGIQGAPQSGTPTFTSGHENVTMVISESNPAKLVDPTTNQPIEGTEIDAKNAAGEKVGKYTIEPATGKVTFTPNPEFTGTPVPATVQAKNSNGTPATATYTPVVKEAVPSGDSQVSSGIQGAVQTATPVFTPGKNTVNGQDVSVPFEPTSKAKLIDPSKTGEESEVTTLVVENQGTYTIDDNGVVTFTPLPTFKGEAKEVSIVRKDKNGTPATAKYKPTVVGVTPSATEATTTKVQGATQETPVTFTPGKATIGTTEKSVPMDPTAYKLLGGQDGKTPLDTVPAMSEDGTKEVGTYTIKVVDGKPVVTFTPTDKTYAGKLKPVTVQGKDTNGTEATTTYTPVITPIVPTSENGKSEGPQGVEQTGSVTFNPGKEPETENTPVAIDKTKMTLLGTDGNPVESLTVSKDGKEIGTYTLVKDPSGVPTGKVTFTPTDKSFVGEVPAATVQVKDANGTPVTATYTPILKKVIPNGESSETQGAKGKPQTSAVVFDKKDEDKSTVNFNKGDEKVALNPSTLTLVDKNGNPSTEVKVPGEGTYTLANNVITFTPESNFAGKTTGVTVQVKDINGTSIEKTYTPTVHAVTTFVDSTGNPITVDKNNKPVESEVDGSNQPTKDIYGYKFVRTETDNKGNTKHIYEQAEGKSVKVTYVSTTGESLNDTQVVTTKDKFIGTDYDASIEALKLERIEKDGKVYLLKERKTDSAAENGKLSDKEQTVTYVYEEVKEPAPKQNFGSVVVVYRDKYGRPISGITDTGKEVGSTVVDTPNSPLTTKYDTTDHKPQTITTKDGKKYKLIKVLKTSDAEKSGVKARTSVITYVYEMLDNTTEYPEAHIGLVLVNYLDEEGNPISGKTPEGKVVPNMVVDTEADLVGKDYDTTDHKVSTIIVENGDVYELLKVSEKSVEKGKLTEGATNVDYIYHKVVTKFVDENGKEIKSPEKGRTDKKDIPEYTFKESKKDENGNTVHVYTKKTPSTPVTPTPTPSTPSTEKETLYVDANGKPLQPAKKGQHPQDKIPGYEFVGTETDANGNVRHLYRKIQSTIPVEPTQPTAPTMPEQPEVPTSSAQPVQPTEVTEVEAKRELPNTGTEDQASLAALGLLGALSGFGLLASKKKED